MNLILFERAETAVALPRSDPRARHLLAVLRRRVGDTFDAGLVDGPRGKGRLEKIDPAAITLSFNWETEIPQPDPLVVIVGLPRPQTARKILQESAALGVAALHFVVCEKTEPGYAASTLWRDGEWRRHLIAGAEQAFTTRLPSVTWDRSLADNLAGLPAGGTRAALDNYEATVPLAHLPMAASPAILALGPERGWAGAERTLLRAHGFVLAHLGARVLRTETACVVALALAKAGLGLW